MRFVAFSEIELYECRLREILGGRSELYSTNRDSYRLSLALQSLATPEGAAAAVVMNPRTRTSQGTGSGSLGYACLGMCQFITDRFDSSQFFTVNLSCIMESGKKGKIKQW